VRGLVLSAGTAKFEQELPAPNASASETRVRVLSAGVCATDLALARGYMDFEGIPGHEFCGVALDGPLEGKRVVGEINAACGTCSACRDGLGRHCSERTVLGILGRSGAFADELALPTENLLEVPDSVSTDAATFCEPLAAAWEIAEQIDLVAGESALVCGDGRLGLLCAHVLAAHGLNVTLAGRHAERANLLGQELTFAEGLLEPDAPREPRYSIVVEATGKPEVFPLALQCLRPRGTLVLKTTSERPGAFDLAPLVVNEITLLGSRCGPFAPALASLASGTPTVENMITARFPLERATDALHAASQRGALKVLIDVHDS